MALGAMSVIAAAAVAGLVLAVLVSQNVFEPSTSNTYEVLTSTNGATNITSTRVSKLTNADVYLDFNGLHKLYNGNDGQQKSLVSPRPHTSGASTTWGVLWLDGKRSQDIAHAELVFSEIDGVSRWNLIDGNAVWFPLQSASYSYATHTLVNGSGVTPSFNGYNFLLCDNGELKSSYYDADGTKTYTTPTAVTISVTTLLCGETETSPNTRRRHVQIDYTATYAVAKVDTDRFVTITRDKTTQVWSEVGITNLTTGTVRWMALAGLGRTLVILTGDNSTSNTYEVFTHIGDGAWTSQQTGEVGIGTVTSVHASGTIDEVFVFLASDTSGAADPFIATLQKSGTNAWTLVDTTSITFNASTTWELVGDLSGDGSTFAYADVAHGNRLVTYQRARDTTGGWTEKSETSLYSFTGDRLGTAGVFVGYDGRLVLSRQSNVTWPVYMFRMHRDDRWYAWSDITGFTDVAEFAVSGDSRTRFEIDITYTTLRIGYGDQNSVLSVNNVANE